MVKVIRWLVLVLAMGLSTIAAATSPTTAGGGEGKHQGTPDVMTEMMRGMGMGRMSDLLGRESPLLSLALRHRGELGLSPDQVRTLEGLVERFRKDAEARMSRVETTEHELAALLKTEPVDLSKVESKVRDIETLRADLRIARIKTLEEGRATLTPDQRTKLESLAAAPAQGRATPRTQGMEEMERFMNSERMPQAMTAMMEMARRMGDGDTMLGMVRMMEMMGSMGGMMGGQGGMTGGPHHDTPREQK